MTTSQPAPETELERLLIAAATSGGDARAVDEFTGVLLTSNVGWLLASNDAGGLAPITVPHPAGDLVPFFSGQATVEHALETLQRPELQAQVLPCRALWEMAVQNRVGTVLNPMSSYGKDFTVPEMSDLLQGIRPGTQTREMASGTRLDVGLPAHVPDALIPALTRHLDGLSGVHKATLAWVRYPDGLEGFLLVIITDLAREQVLAGIDDAASHTDGPTLDILVSAAEDGLVADVAPFYPPVTHS